MAATATDLILYEGVYDDLIVLWDRLVEDQLFFDCGASRNAYKHEGKKTLAYEIAEQSGWRVPDLVGAPRAVGQAVHPPHPRPRGTHRPPRTPPPPPPHP